MQKTLDESKKDKYNNLRDESKKISIIIFAVAYMAVKIA